jgi:hypothetical protein
MEQQQQQRIHQKVLEGIERFSEPNRIQEEKHKLFINGYNTYPNVIPPTIDRHSLRLYRQWKNLTFIMLNCLMILPMAA